MNASSFSDKIVCAYLYPITKYGYPPDVRRTTRYIEEMAALGFRSIELEGIGDDNIRYLSQHREEVREKLEACGCRLPVLCLVLPRLGSVNAEERKEALELFETGCALARGLGADAVLDNGPLLPLQYPADAPVQRHYAESDLAGSGLPDDFVWEEYWSDLCDTFRQACSIAASYQLSYHMHPCEGSLISDTDSFVNFSASVDSPNLLFNLDTANQLYFRDHLPLSVFRLQEKIRYIHISDNGGERVEHLVPGDGAVNWESFFEALAKINYQGYYALDIGGAESGVLQLDDAYLRSARWLQEQLTRYSLVNV